jgi:hypothetical protein
MRNLKLGIRNSDEPAWLGFGFRFPAGLSASRAKAGIAGWAGPFIVPIHLKIGASDGLEI